VVQIPKGQVNPTENMIFWAAGISNLLLLLFMALEIFKSRVISILVSVFVVATVCFSALLFWGTIREGKFNMENIIYFALVSSPIYFGIRRLIKMANG